MSAAPDPALRAALEEFAAGRDALAAGIRVAKLPGGFSNSSWHVSSSAGDWVVRLAGGDDARYAINRVAERQAHAAAAALGFAPAIVHCAAERGVLVSEYLAAAPMSRDEARAVDGIAAIGARLRELHDCPPPRAVRRLDLHDVLAHYLDMRVPPGPISRKAISARLRWALATYRPRPPAFCHNDLHHLNILVGPRLWLVDWEYAGVGEPLFELAAVASYHDYGDAERHGLLTAYGGGYSPQTLGTMCEVFDCLHALWLDAARGWDSVSPPQRAALIARLEAEPGDRSR